MFIGAQAMLAASMATTINQIGFEPNGRIDFPDDVIA
jgi:hypothetical protein